MNLKAAWVLSTQKIEVVPFETKKAIFGRSVGCWISDMSMDVAGAKSLGG